ncbi:MAG: septum site-determining protein MinC [Herpetosiphon sp.]
MGAVAVKGGRDGLRLVLADTLPWRDVLAALREQMSHNPEFFHGVELTVDIGDRPLQDGDLPALMEVMAEHNLQPAVLATATREGRTAGRTAGLVTRASPKSQAGNSQNEPDAALMVHRTLRSGQVLRHPGDVTVIGDINPGAEVIAGGSIVVWGRIRGSIHAGALGNPAAMVCAIEMTPTMLRIGEDLARTPKARPAGTKSVRLTKKEI